MGKKIDKQIEKLSGLRLPDLQAKFAAIVGEETRSPNKAFLLRRIREVLERQQRAPRTNGGGTRRGRPPSGLTKLTVEELQQRYLEEVGRPTDSEDRAYLAWKIRMARNGKIRVGPAREPRGEVQNLPFTIERDAVQQLDAARERLGFKTRQALFRRAVHQLLMVGGERDTAKLFEDA
jgi:hypothetical protein